MTAEKLYALLGDVKDEHISRAETYHYAPKFGKKTWLSLAAAAACLCLVVSAWSNLPAKDLVSTGNRFDGVSTPGEAAPSRPAPEAPGAAPAPEEAPAPAPSTPEEVGPLSFTMAEGTYIQSSHLTTITLTLPEGFSYAGETKYGPGYTNADAPYWIYVRQTVNTDGRVDETNTMIPIEPQPGYVRYVIQWLQGTDLVCVDDRLYCRASGSRYEIHDMTYDNTLPQAEYDRIRDQYGFRMETDTVEGFSMLGEAAFTGLDTVPTGALAASMPDAVIYTSPKEPNMVLVESTWHSVKGEHHGFDVYLKWEVPVE